MFLLYYKTIPCDKILIKFLFLNITSVILVLLFNFNVLGNLCDSKAAKIITKKNFKESELKQIKKTKTISTYL